MWGEESRARKVGGKKWGEKVRREKCDEKSGARKLGRGKWGKDIEKSGTRKVEVRKVGREKWGRGKWGEDIEESGATNEGREKWR